MAGRERQVSSHQAVLPREMVCRAKHCLQAGEGGTLWETACLLKAVFDAMINNKQKKYDAVESFSRAWAACVGMMGKGRRWDEVHRFTGKLFESNLPFANPKGICPGC
ncbi:MAG: hypothetical protein Q3W86_06125, partial [Evtepia sp.]|nr:hypothetical protein [Evtepia sp.]